VLAASVGRQYAASRYSTAGTHEIARSTAKAVSTLRESIRLDPFSLTTRYALAAAYARENRYEQARAALLSAAAREPHAYTTPALLGDLASRHGDYRLAAAEYRRALALNPGDRSLRAAARVASEEKP
jgi:tetratricopeptide (TPR) repeat protein